MAVPRAAQRAQILSVMKSSKTMPRVARPGSFRTPRVVTTNEVNPLKRLEKGIEKIPAGAKNPFKFVG